jgi:LEA14-like dessication related protein
VGGGFAQAASVMKRTLFYASLLTLACVLLSAVTLTLSGCSTVANIVNPSYSLRAVDPHLNLAIPPSLDVDFTIGVDNQNPVAVRLDRFDFDLLINDTPVLNNVRSDQGIHIPARGLGDVHLNAHVNFSDLQTIGRQLIDVIRGNRASYQIRGNAYYDTPLGQLRFPVTVAK